MAAVQEVAHTCEELVQGRAQHAATIDTLAQHAEDAAAVATSTQAAVFQQVRASGFTCCAALQASIVFLAAAPGFSS